MAGTLAEMAVEAREARQPGAIVSQSAQGQLNEALQTLPPTSRPAPTVVATFEITFPR